MSVAIVLRTKKDVQLVHWAARVASAKKVELILLWAQQRRGPAKVQSIAQLDACPQELLSCCEDLLTTGFNWPSHSDNGVPANGTLPLKLLTINSERIARDIEREVETHRVQSLFLPRDASVRSGAPEAEFHAYLISNVPIEIILLTPGKHEAGLCREIVSPVGEGPHSASCLKMANALATTSQARLIALHVEPEIDETAKLAAGRILSKAVERALGGSRQGVIEHVEMAENVIDGISRVVSEKTDLVILGLKRSGLSKRFNTGGIAGQLVEADRGPTIAVVQSAVPIASRFGRGVDELLSGWVPQLPRDQRIGLVERVQRSSRWDFDFILLICLSTIIAAGGLIQNSPAVVIGAMLVAPLMTPLLGAGLAMVQGNPILFRNTLYTVLRGFLLAFGVAICVAITAKMFVGVTLTDEMMARGQPSALDILIAMVGGIAAAYASGRPNLLSALPGVAIAAALVPPIATSGIAVWLGEFELAFRSVLLFLTNIVAIILGTAMAFRATGIRGIHQYGTLDRWTLPAGSALLLLTISLGIFESMPTKTALSDSFTDQINQIARADTWQCDRVLQEAQGGTNTYIVYLTSHSAVPEQRLAAIRQTLNDGKQDPAKVRFVVEISE